MKIVARLVLAGAAFAFTFALGGCVVVPAEPVAYAGPPPGVVVVPGRTYFYGGYYHHYYGGGRWRHWR